VRKKPGGLVLTIYTSYDLFCARSCLLGVAMIAPALKIFGGVNFFNHD